eukprot:s5112_g2.t3
MLSSLRWDGHSAALACQSASAGTVRCCTLSRAGLDACRGSPGRWPGCQDEGPGGPLAWSHGKTGGACRLRALAAAGGRLEPGASPPERRESASWSSGFSTRPVRPLPWRFLNTDDGNSELTIYRWSQSPECSFTTIIEAASAILRTCRYVIEPPPVVPVAQWRSQKLEPLLMPPRPPRPPSAEKPVAGGRPVRRPGMQNSASAASSRTTRSQSARRQRPENAYGNPYGAASARGRRKRGASNFGDSRRHSCTNVMAAGMFVAAAKGNGNASFQERGSAAAPRKRPELGHLVQRPTVTAAGQPAAKRRIGGITLLATWQLKDDAKVDPHCVICRFQIRIARTSRLPAGEQAVWKEAQPFFCVSAEEVQKQYMAFLSDFLQYGEEYIVSARDLEPPDFARFCCDVLAPRESGILEIFRTRDHALHFAFPAFKSFDPRTPLPVEYCIEAWQRPDDVGAAAAEQLQALSRLSDGKGKMPGSGPDWEQSSPIFVTSVKSDLVQGNPVECSVDIRSTALVQRSQVFFSVRARYLSLPGETNFSPKLLWSGAPVFIPELVPVLAAPVALPSADCEEWGQLSCSGHFDIRRTFAARMRAVIGSKAPMCRTPLWMTSLCLSGFSSDA